MPDPTKLRELALWYREFAERAANPVIWESRLRMAEDLEAEAEKAEGASNVKQNGRRSVISASARAR